MYDSLRENLSYFGLYKRMFQKESVPLLSDTDMERYAQIYQHYGCVLYNQTSASNGVTRYNLVWTKDK